MKLIDLNQTIFVPVVDETKGGMTVEMKMTVGEFFSKFCQGFEPQTVEAITVEWLEKRRQNLILAAMVHSTVYGDNSVELCHAVNVVLDMWKKEQEAR